MSQALKPFYSLAAHFNKAEIEQDDEQVQLSPELQLSMSDEQLLNLAKAWKSKSEDYQARITPLQEVNERYWKGNHFSNAEMETGHAMVDNLIFEALETFIPNATKKNPDPTVYGPKEAQMVAKSVQQYLAAEADRERLQLRLQRAVRYWALHLLACGKFTWDMRADDSRMDITRVQDLLLDPDGYVNDDMEFTGEYVGHKCKDKISHLIKRFPNKSAYFNLQYAGKLGTKAKYIEWWTDEYVFWTNMECSELLSKAKNPHWNYDLEEDTEKEVEVPYIDDYGVDQVRKEMQPAKETITGANHFEYKKKPFIFLSMFSLGTQPHDETSLIGQNIANQDMINKRNKQIDKNVDKMNAGLVISGSNSGLSKEDAALAAKAIDRGGAIFIPDGAPNDAIARISGQPLPGDVFAQRDDMRNELRNIFGVRGSSPSGTINEQTATGKSIVREQDSDRIGGGISKYIEQFADQYFNWKVQMMYVYYDEEHTANVMGTEQSQEVVSILHEQLAPFKLTVSVKPGSMLPHDEVTEAGTASDLASQNLLDPITLYDKLGFPDPRGTAKKLWIWKNAPEKLFGDDPEIRAIIDQQAADAARIAAESVIPPGPPIK